VRPCHPEESEFVEEMPDDGVWAHEMNFKLCRAFSGLNPMSPNIFFTAHAGQDTNSPGRGKAFFLFP